MDIKLIEIRDRDTCIPALAIKLRAADDTEVWLLKRAGFGALPTKQATYVLFSPLAGMEMGTISYDEFQWQERAGRTLRVAHCYLIDHYDEIPSGGVVDVEYILSETDKPKISERLEDENNSGA